MKNRFSHNERGGATVEVALLSLVMVPMSLYAVFFFDLSLMHLKILEVSRYAAWELTAMPSTNWNDGKSKIDANLKLLISEGDQNGEIQKRWGDDMNSATGDLPGLFDEKITGLTVTKLQEDSIKFSTSDMARVQNTKPLGDDIQGQDEEVPENSEGGDLLAELADKILGFVGTASNFVYEEFGFNEDGFIGIPVSATLELSRNAPLPIFHGEGLFGNLTTFSFGSKEKLLVDAWKLHNGEDVDYGQNDNEKKGEEYRAQVNRMYLVGLPNAVSGLFRGGGSSGDGFLGGAIKSILDKVLDAVGVHNPFIPMVRSYALKGSTQESPGCSPSGTSCINFDQYVADPLGTRPRKTFYTNTVKDTSEWMQSSYYKVYKRQSPTKEEYKLSGGFYMGCPEPEVVDCWQN